MRFAAKQILEERGYNVTVGRAQNTFGSTSDEFTDIVAIDTMGARYILRTQERPERFAPIVCIFNGFWWWRFNVSIADQKTGEELLAWTGRGCADGNIRRLNRLMDRLEKSP